MECVRQDEGANFGVNEIWNDVVFFRLIAVAE